MQQYNTLIKAHCETMEIAYNKALHYGSLGTSIIIMSLNESIPLQLFVYL